MITFYKMTPEQAVVHLSKSCQIGGKICKLCENFEMKLLAVPTVPISSCDDLRKKTVEETRLLLREVRRQFPCERAMLSMYGNFTDEMDREQIRAVVFTLKPNSIFRSFFKELKENGNHCMCDKGKIIDRMIGEYQLDNGATYSEFLEDELFMENSFHNMMSGFMRMTGN